MAATAPTVLRQEVRDRKALVAAAKRVIVAEDMVMAEIRNKKNNI